MKWAPFFGPSGDRSIEKGKVFCIYYIILSSFDDDVEPWRQALYYHVILVLTGIVSPSNHTISGFC